MVIFNSVRAVTSVLVLSNLISFAQGPNRPSVVDRGSLCVTEGQVEKGSGNRLLVESTKMRAYVNRRTRESIEAHFTYLGGTAQESRLGSGEIRRQFGLKLRAQDACNLVYAIWRIEPESRVVVSIKRNPGQTTSTECGNRGYQNVRPRRTGPIPVLRRGDSHTLGADLRGSTLKVSVDGAVVWEGDLGPEAQNLTGPVGIRSDNVRLSFDLDSEVLSAAPSDAQPGCKSGPGSSD